MEHSAAKDYGENLYVCINCKEINMEQAVKAWYDEIKSYNFEKAQFSPETGHFTQVVWKGSQKLGVGFAFG